GGGGWRAREVAGDVERRGRAGEGARPVRELLLRIRSLHPLALGDRDVAEPHRQRRQGRRQAVAARAVEAEELAREDHERPAVVEQVVLAVEEDVLAGRDAEERPADERQAVEDERRRRGLAADRLDALQRLVPRE